MDKIDIVIPVQRYTQQLERTLMLLDKYKNNVETEIHVIERSDLNVSEARQLALDNQSLSDKICYLDDDSEMIHDHWLDEMLETMNYHADAAAVFGGEWWGTEDEYPIDKVEGGVKLEVNSGGTPAACMLIDRAKLDETCFWDQNIGLRSGWLGGDFEEVDFCWRLHMASLGMYKSTGTLFHHTGGKSTLIDFSKTDRAVCVAVMRTLLAYKYAKFNNDEDFFKALKYVKADPNDDCMLAAGYSLRGCYKDVIDHANLKHHPQFVRGGLV
jgi:hypothetical protein